MEAYLQAEATVCIMAQELTVCIMALELGGWVGGGGWVILSGGRAIWRSSSS
jgi:hypothetical protein